LSKPAWTVGLALLCYLLFLGKLCVFFFVHFSLFSGSLCGVFLDEQKGRGESLAICVLLISLSTQQPTGEGGPIKWLLESRPFTVVSRLTYCMYLIHPGKCFGLFGIRC
jgi:peptidoglycan/LPS O-acetylase OafA/YrhL